MLDDVSLPVRNTPSQPRKAATKGKTNPVFEKAMARLDVMPEKFMRYAIERMNAMVTMGSASWRRVCAYTLKKFTRRLLTTITSHATMQA